MNNNAATKLTATARFVDTDKGMAALLAAIAAQSSIALDTEFVRERTYYPNLCLIQINTNDNIWCLDPLAFADIHEFFELINEPHRRKVFHAARQDLEIFFNCSGRLPSGLFDTQIAAGLTGRADQISYAGLVADICEITLDKSSSRTNWARRPLSGEQLRYAADDVRYLDRVRHELAQELESLGRSQWFVDECRGLENVELYDNAPAQAWKRIKGLVKLDEKTRAIAASLAAWRETEAQERDLPRGWVLKDDRLIAVARAAPRSIKELVQIEGLPKGLIRRSSESILDIVRAPSLSPKVQAMTYRLTSKGKALLAEMLRELNAVAAREKVAVALIATRREIEAAILGERDIRVYEGWRAELFGNDLRSELAAEAVQGLYE